MFIRNNEPPFTKLLETLPQRAGKGSRDQAKGRGAHVEGDPRAGIVRGMRQEGRGASGRVGVDVARAAARTVRGGFAETLTYMFVASKMLTKRHVAFEHFGRHVLHCFFALPSIKAASMRWLAPLNSTSLPWWTILSIMADASLSSPRTVPHFENSMFVVNIMLRLS